MKITAITNVSNVLNNTMIFVMSVIMNNVFLAKNTTSLILSKNNVLKILLIAQIIKKLFLILKMKHLKIYVKMNV